MEEIADKTIARKTGARGLRAIIEKSMRDLMFTIPSDGTIQSCLVTKDVIDGNGEPVVIRKGQSDKLQKHDNQEKIEETA